MFLLKDLFAFDADFPYEMVSEYPVTLSAYMKAFT